MLSSEYRKRTVKNTWGGSPRLKGIVSKMETHGVKEKKTRNKALSLLLGLIFTLVCTLPYLYFRSQLQEAAGLGYLGLILFCAISNATILLPSRATLMVLAAATALDPVLCALCGGVGTALGEQSGYLCGRIGASGFDRTLTHRESRIAAQVARYQFPMVFLFALLPLPLFDVVGLAAGVLHVKWPKFAAAVLLGKLLKFLLLLVLAWEILPWLAGLLPGPAEELFRQVLGQLS